MKTCTMSFGNERGTLSSVKTKESSMLLTEFVILDDNKPKGTEKLFERFVF